jgi:hypothetical protein
MAQTFYQLKKALGIHGSAFHSLAITNKQYMNDHFVIGVDTEKILEAGFTGLNTRAGDLMIVRGKGANANYDNMGYQHVYHPPHRPDPGDSRYWVPGFRLK